MPEKTPDNSIPIVPDESLDFNDPDGLTDWLSELIANKAIQRIKERHNEQDPTTQ